MKLIFLLLVTSLQAQPIKHPADFHVPFWKSKPQVQKRILKENLIVVSAQTKKIQDKPELNHMKVVAGGIVKAPFEFVFTTVTDYPKLTQVSAHFKEARYNKESQTLYLHLEALGYHERMTLKLNEIDDLPSDKKIKQIHWESISGRFKGMKGVFQVEEIERHKTEISMTADYRSEKLPLPKILMGLGLEIVGRQVAVKMREYILDQYKK